MSNLPDMAHLEDEFKLLWPEAPVSASRRLAVLRPLIEQSGLLLAEVRPPAPQTDVYFDNEAGALLSGGISFRLRRTEKAPLLTLKLPPPKPGERGRFRRQEVEEPITPADEWALLRGQAIEAAPFRLLARALPEAGRLRPAARVRTLRQVVPLATPAGRRAELAVDRVTYESGGARWGPETEVEIENRDLPAKVLRALATRLEKDLGLVPAWGSKYERARRGGP